MPRAVARIVQVPPNNITTEELSIARHISGVSDVRTTGNPELDVAITEMAVELNSRLAIGAMVMVCGSGGMVRTCETLTAGDQVESPACDATTIQLPGVKIYTPLPCVPQTSGVDEAYVTARPEVAIAATVKVVFGLNWNTPMFWLVPLLICGNEMVCVRVAMVILCEMLGAAAKAWFPACAATIVQTPGVRTVTALALMVQTLKVVDVNVTARPDEAVATTVRVDEGNATVPLPRAGKLIVCGVIPTPDGVSNTTVRSTGVAA